MNDELFNELVESVRQGGAILRGKARPSRAFEIDGAREVGNSTAGQAPTVVADGPQFREVVMSARSRTVLTVLGGIVALLFWTWASLSLGAAAMRDWAQREVKKAYGDAFAKWAVAPSRVTIPGGEDFKEFVGRVKNAMRAIERKHRDGNVLLVSHGGVISTYATQILNLPPDDIWCLTVRNASLTIVDVKPSIHRIVTFNDTSHLMSLREIKKSEVRHVA